MSALEQVIPKGYKQTEVGIIPEDWEIDSIGNLVSITTGNKNTQDRVNDGLYPFFVRSQTVERINSFSFDGEGVLTAGDGVGTGKIFHYMNGKFDFHQRVYLMYNFGEKLFGYYFYIYFSNNFYDRIMSMTAKSSVDSVRREMISEMKVSLPPYDEQTAIANALSDVDALLTELEKLIAKKQAIKTATMQQLLTGKTRLPQFATYTEGEKQGQPKGTKLSELGEIPEDWDVYSLDKIITSTQLGGNYSNSEAESSFPLIKMGNLGRGKIKLDKLECANEAVSARDRLKFDDVLFNTRNTLELVGKVAIWKDELPEAYFNSNIMRFAFNNNLVSSNSYMNAAMNTKRFVTDLAGIATGTTSVAAIYTRDLLQLKLLVPPKEEQTAIATILSDMGNEIQTLEQRLAKTRQTKQGMMQELLTGRTRLPF
jgi:type I restriction enzyme S subunit